MGVKNLWDILESCKKTLPLHHLKNKRVCVDLSCWIVQLHNVNKSHCPLKEKLYLKGLFHRLRALIALNCNIVFIADGSIPAIKLSTYRRRLNPLNEPILDPCEVSSVKRNMGSEFSRMIKEAKLLGLALGIPCLDGIEEAEAQCAVLNSESLCDGCYTSDSDAFLFGARTVYRDICLGEGGYVVCYEMDDIERKLGFGRNSLISLAILLGSDYTQGVRGFGPESACKIVKAFGEAAVLQRLASEGLSALKKGKGSKKKDQIFTSDNKENVAPHNLNKSDYDSRKMNDHFVSVINAYLKPKCHSADSDVVHRVLAVYPFNRSQLHEICARFFEWPPEKTDEYILPKIAERSLRRFSNLRLSSSQLGVNLPADEMPVKCPMSCINKQRRIQGRDYYEVSWEDMCGLKASTVPSDLVDSACPEKIQEFHEKKLEKRKPRPKKAGTKEIDEKLRKLLLEIEQESSVSATSGLRGFISEKIPAVAQQSRRSNQEENYQQECFISSQVDVAESSYGASLCCSSVTISTEMEIVDLTSPPPAAKAHNLIELSDSESEASPEHARKAKELRVLITSLR